MRLGIDVFKTDETIEVAPVVAKPGERIENVLECFSKSTDGKLTTVTFTFSVENEEMEIEPDLE